MTKFIHKIGGMVAGVAFGALAFTSCSEQIDESNLYTFTGETITDYLRSDSTLSDFAKITEYAGLSDRLSAYGTYTCFAPTNEAVKEYIQELWEDKKSANHNGLYTGDVSEGNTIDRLWKSEKRDSLCKDIVEAHLTGLKKTSNDLLTGSDITMMGGNTHSPKRVGDDITIDGTTKIINRDHEVENGVVHTIDKLFYRSTNYIIDEMENMGIYSIWCDALKQTGLDEVMKEHIRTNGISWFTMIRKPNIHLLSILQAARWDSPYLQRPTRYSRIKVLPTGKSWQPRQTSGTRIALPGTATWKIIRKSRSVQVPTIPISGIH